VPNATRPAAPAVDPSEEALRHYLAREKARLFEELARLGHPDQAADALDTATERKEAPLP
jgi:hypothetical protein